MAFVCTYEVWVIAFSHYASLLRVGVLSAAPVAVEKIGINTGSFLFILHALFLQGFLHISFFVRLRIGYIAKAL